MNHSCERFPYMAGTFAEYSYVWPEAGRSLVPDEVPSEWASASRCPHRTAVGIVETAGHIQPTDTVVVQGAGPLGLFTAALVSLQHPRELIVVGAPAERLSVAADWGATTTLDLSEYADADARVAAMRELTNGDGADVVFERSGVPAALGEGLSMAAAGARVVVAGIVGATETSIPAHLITVGGLSVKGSFGGDIDAYWKGLEFLRLHRERFDVGRLLGNGYRLDEVTTALERMRSMEEIKPIVRPDAG